MAKTKLKLSFKILLVFLFVIFTSLIAFSSEPKRLNCKNAAPEDKVTCWKKLIDNDLERGNLEKSLDLVARLYEDDTDFANNCHDFIHTVGKEAYVLFSKGKDFGVNAKASYCSYGFYHGFMQSLVADTGDAAMAREFCTKIDKELSKDSPGSKLACYHGIGHGWTDSHDESLWGNERGMVTPALELCKKVTQDPEELKICATGVFDSISIGYYNQQNGLQINKEDPFWLCREQEELFKEACYMDLSPAILWLGGYRLDNSLLYLTKTEKKYFDLELATIAENSARFILRDNLNIEDQVNICRGLGEDKKQICIKGLALGFLQFGRPGKEEEAAMSFCKHEFLTREEKEVCFKSILENMTWIFSETKMSRICSDVPEEYEKYCNK